MPLLSAKKYQTMTRMFETLLMTLLSATNFEIQKIEKNIDSPRLEISRNRSTVQVRAFSNKINPQSANRYVDSGDISSILFIPCFSSFESLS